MFTQAVGMTASDRSVSDVVKIRQDLVFLILYKNYGLILRLKAKCLLKIARHIVDYTLNLNSFNFLAQMLGHKSKPYLAEISPVFGKKLSRTSLGDRRS